MRERVVGVARRGLLVVSVLGLVSIAAHAGAAPATAPPGGDADAPPASDQSGPPTLLELIPDLGNGGQPDGLSREIVIAGERFLFDRIVALRRQDFVRIAQEQEIIAYARVAQGPFPAVYVSAPPRADEELARYLPERLGQPDITCPAEAANVDPVDTGEARYVFAGTEADLTADALQVVGDSAGEPIYSDPSSAPPHPELFVGSDGGLLRFVLTGPDGRPASISESLAFNGAEFAFDSDATASIDPAALTKVGCSTAFPVYAPAGSAADAFTQLYVVAGNRYFLFTGDGAPPAATTTAPPATTTVPPTTTTTVPPTTTTTTTVPPTTTTTVPPTTTTTTTVPPTTTTTTTTATTVPPTTTTTTVLPTSTTSEPAGTTTSTAPEFEPPAVVSTLPPGAPPAAASTAVEPPCAGDPGELDDAGVPVHLPTRIQVAGVAYLFVRDEPLAEAGTLSRIGCVGPFELTITDEAEQADVVFLRSPAPDRVFRFEAAITFEVQFEASEQPQTITALDQRYRLAGTWQPSVFSSTSVVLFVEDPDQPAPEVVYGLNVTQTVVGDAVGEYRSVDGPTQPPTELAAAAELAGLHPDLVVDGQPYVLVDVYTPTGTTRNGFMTLFDSTTDANAEVLLGRDKRDVELFVFVREGTAETEG